MQSWDDYFKSSGGSKPVVEVKIKGKTLKTDNLFITYAEVCSSVGSEASTCSIQLEMPNSNFKKSKFTSEYSLNLSSDFEKVQVGAQLEVALGFDLRSQSSDGKRSGKVSTTKVFKGYISSFDIEINNKRMISLTIQGMDAKMWMMTSKKTELKKGQKKYSKIVKNICSDYSGKLDGEKIQIKNEVEFESEIYQQDESDYEFLNRISMLTGCMFFISLGKLYFVSLSALKSTKLKIMPYNGIYNLKMSVSVWGIPKKVEVISTDTKDYQNIISAQATTSEAIGSGKPASSLSNNISDVNTIKILDDTVSSVSEAKFLAEAIYNQRDLNLAELDLEILGCPSVELGKGVKVDGFGDPIDNDYIVTGICHICDISNLKYVTNLKLKTNRVTPKESLLGGFSF